MVADMADKPSRALVLYAAGHAAVLAPPPGSAAAGSHLDAFASRASCGLLTLRPRHPSVAAAPSHTSTATGAASRPREGRAAPTGSAASRPREGLGGVEPAQAPGDPDPKQRNTTDARGCT